MIGEKFNLDNKSVCFLLRYYNIQIRTIKETRHLSEYKNRIEKTNLERYGAVNPLSKGTCQFNINKNNHNWEFVFIRNFNIFNIISDTSRKG